MFDFRKTKDTDSNKLFLFLKFQGGDADTEHPELIEFKGVKFSEYKDHLEKIKSVIDKYKILKNILEDHTNYRDVKVKYGDEIADMYDNVPNDPQNDYQFKCYLGTIKLIGYDEIGSKFESYI